MDLTELKMDGVQVIRDFFPEDVRADLRRRADEVLAMREQGKLSTDSQDAMGLPDEWFSDILRAPRLVDFAVKLFGPNVCASGWRVLMKDRFFRSGVKVHQDFPYNEGESRKLNVFLPLTRVNEANGGLFFCKESHLYGPVLRGGIDLSRVDPMEEICPDIDVGDIVFADFLTWHYSAMAWNDDPRIMLQLVYQPASDPSSNNVVAGVSPVKRLLRKKSDAMGLLESELNGRAARRYFERGDTDKARRWALGLVNDDPDHVGAAVLMTEILKASGDPAALQYLELARKGLVRLQQGVRALEIEFGLRDADEATAAASETVAPASGGAWRPLNLLWQENNVGYIDQTDLPVALPIHPDAWEYGSSSRDLITPDGPAVVRLRCRSEAGKVGICLLDEAYSNLLSDVHVVVPEDGDVWVMLALDPAKGPARILMRNEGDGGRGGALIVTSVDIMEMSAAA